MLKAAFRYDEPADTLYVSFAPGDGATGIELNEHILLRVDARKRSAVGLTFFDFPVLAQRTELEPRSFPLTGLAEVSPDLRELAISLLLSDPVRKYLALSAYMPAARQVIPITQIRSENITAHAA